MSAPPRSTLPKRFFFLTVFGISLLIAIGLSPLASQNPDGLDRVAQDHNFKTRASQTSLAQKLPFHALFEEYSMRHVPPAIATPLAGLVGTGLTFGLAWGLGKLAARRSHPSEH